MRYYDQWRRQFINSPSEEDQMNSFHSEYDQRTRRLRYSGSVDERRIRELGYYAESDRLVEDIRYKIIEGITAKFMERIEPAIDKVLSEIFPQPGDDDADRCDPQP